MEQALKEKQSALPTSTIEAITSTQPTGQPAESSQVDTSNLSSEQLVKQMNDLKLQVTEL